MTTKHFGMCDASAAIALDSDHFVVANDEDNFLRVYRTDTSGKYIEKISLLDYFDNNPDPENDEADIEGAALLGDTIYWITSHARDKDGDLRPERRNFFANKIAVTGSAITANQVGRSYPNLLDDLFNDERFDKYDLRQAAQLAPKEEGGLNIEGLTATPDGRLLIGFRNPIRDGKALLVPLHNPAEVVGGSQAIFGPPIDLGLGGLGVRSIEYWAKRECYLIIAGSYEPGGEFRLYQWSGRPTESPIPLNNVDLSGLNPEVIIIYPDIDHKIQVLSDDGSVELHGEKCKDLDDDDEKCFRSVWVTL